VPFQLPRGLSFTWFGHSTFLVTTPQGKRILFDPFLTGNPSTPADKKDPGPVDLILVTHGHGDHIGDLVPVAQKTGAPIVAIPEIVGYLKKKGIDSGKLIPVNKGGTVHPEGIGIAVTMTTAFHSGGIQDGDQTIYGGEPAGFVVTLEDGFAFYNAGDTCVFSDMGLIAELYQPRLALLPIGDCYTMGPKEAARAAKFLTTVEAIIPMHYGTFPVLTGTPEALRAELAKIGSATEVLAMTPGQTLGG